MPTKREALRITVGLIAMNDADLLDQPDLIIEFCETDDRQKLRRAVRVMNELYSSFDYTQSREFIKALEGASVAVQQMKRRFVSDPVKRKQAKDRFKDALKRLLESDDAFDLVSPQDERRLREVRETFESLKNPS